jgi:hypothetical protein
VAGVRRGKSTADHSALSEGGSYRGLEVNPPRLPSTRGYQPDGLADCSTPRGERDS